MAGRKRDIRLQAPYLRKVWLDRGKVTDAAAYPFCLPLFKGSFEQEFRTPIPIIAGENGVGKSTLLEGIAAIAGFDQAGGGKGYMPVDHSDAKEVSGGALAVALRASWLPRLSDGWFFRAESFFSVARYLDAVGSSAADFLSYSHGEGFLLFSRNDATVRGSTFLTNRRRRCLRRGKSSSLKYWLASTIPNAVR